MIFRGDPDPLSPPLAKLAVCPNIPDFTLYILPPWICHNGIGPTTVPNNFVTVRDIGYSEKIWGYLPVHEGYLPDYFKEYCYLPPSLNKPLQYMGIL